MKASLASATSIAALLAFQANPAHAALFTLDTTTLNYGDILVGHSAATTQTVTLTDTASAGTLNGNFGKASAPFSGAQKNFSLTASGQTVKSNGYNFTAIGAGITGSQTWTTTVAVFGSDSKLAATQTTNVTLTGIAVAPIETVNGVNNNASINEYVLVGTTGTATVTAKNVGHGNLAGPDAPGFQSNLHGTVGAGNSVIVGSGGTVNLKDSQSQSFNYTYSPTVRGSTGSAVITTSFTNGSPLGSNDAFVNNTTITATAVAPVNSVSTTGTLARFNTKGGAGVGIGNTTSNTATVTVTNTGDGNKSGLGAISNLNGSVTSPGASVFAGPTSGSPFSLTDGSSTTVNYTYSPIARGTDTTGVTAKFTNGSNDGKNTAQNIGLTLNGQGVGPTYNSSLGTTAANAHTAQVSKVYNTPTPNTGTSPIAFGTVGANTTHTLYLDIANTSTDPNGGNSLLTDLSLESFSITGPQAANYSIPAGTTPQVLHEFDGTNDIVVPVTFHSGSAKGLYLASLTFITDESVGFGALGDTFTYALSGSVVPEPASLLLLSMGLGGIFYVRKRRSHA